MIISGADTTVTIKDTKVNGSITTSGVIARVREGATLNIESGSFTSTGDTAFWAGGKDTSGNIVIGDSNNSPIIQAQEFAIGAGKDSVVIINNGSLTAKDNAVLAGNGSTGYEGAEFVINGGTFKGEIQSSGYTGCGVYLPNSGKVTINDGEFDIDGVGVCARAGQVEINGGTFKSNVETSGWVGDNKNKVEPLAVHYDGAANYPGLALGDNALTINGGTFTKNQPTAFKVTQPTNGQSIEVSNSAGWGQAE